MGKLTEYVAGFLFDVDWQRVALIEKKRPEWQRGKLNGIGGHIEENESPINAMIREFKEEAGTDVTDWEYFCVLSGYGYDHEGVWSVHFFTSHNTNRNFQIQSVDEEVLWINHENLYSYSVLPNLHWLIPMAFAGPKGAFGNVWPFNIVENAGITTIHSERR